MEDIVCEGYELELVPKTANKDKKTGVTIKGSESQYLDAHKMLKDMIQKKGDRFLINGVEVGVLDTPKNNPFIIEVKPKGGLSGKVNLTIFDINNRGGATIMITKVKGGDTSHVRILGIEVIKYFLDGVIEGIITDSDLGKYKLKNQKIMERNKKIKCQFCEQMFQTDQGLKIHTSKIHTEKGENYCGFCRIKSKNDTEFKAHMELEHLEIISPQAKKRRRDTDEIGTDKDLVELEGNSWEEMRMRHREVEIQVNEEELLNMNDFDMKRKNTEVLTKLTNMETKNDEKVLEKQKTWFEEEVRYQEMKRKLSEDRMKEENKRKRQLSIVKKKKSKSKKGKKLKNDIDILSFKDEESDIIVTSDTEEGNEEGPGYMGWKSDDDEKAAMRKAFEEIRQELQELKNGEIKQKKQINNLEKDVKSLKEEYKQCLEALSKETYERNKAEEMNKILIETLEAENKKKEAEKNEKHNNIENISGEEMLIEEDHLCEECNLSYDTKSNLEKHMRSLHVGRIERTEFKCETCNKAFRDEEQLKSHAINVHADKVFTCQKCDKPYTSMSLLRRHDWRSHREIECNMCGETLRNREEIKTHRQSKHNMFKKVFCKYFPECLDGDECFFEHEKDNSVSITNESSNCPDGEKCNNQSCNFSEQKHASTILCKFQAKCNRLNCQFKHNVPRNVFLGESFIRNQIN